MLNFYRRVIKYLKKNGITSFFSRTIRFFYEKKFIKKYYKELALNKEQEETQKNTRFECNPKISIIIPLYNTPISFFKELMDTIINQTYGNWELCLADGTAKKTELTDLCLDYMAKDVRIKYKLLDTNGGISDNTNAALKMATGEFIMLADHDDLLEKDALFEVVKAINADGNIDSIYSDEDKIAKNSKKKFEPHLKPDFNIEYLRTNNYICHIFVTRRQIALEIGGFCKEFDGAQDFDFILKCCEKSRVVYHIPRILYHWRCHINSTAGRPESKMYAYEAGAKAVKEHYKRVGMEATVENDGLSYGYYISKRSIDKKLLKNVEIVREDNVKAINNILNKTDKEYIMLIDKQTEYETDCIEKMLEYAQDKQVVAVTCKIISKDKRIIQGPIVLGAEGVYSYKMYNQRENNPGYFRCMTVAQNVTLADYRCVMIKKSIARSQGGLDESMPLGLGIFNYSLRAENELQRTVFVPYTRVVYKGENKLPKFEQQQLEMFESKWFDRIKKGDSYFNKNFDLCKKAFF